MVPFRSDLSFIMIYPRCPLRRFLLVCATTGLKPQSQGTAEDVAQELEDPKQLVCVRLCAFSSLHARVAGCTCCELHVPSTSHHSCAVCMPSRSLLL